MIVHQPGEKVIKKSVGAREEDVGLGGPLWSPAVIHQQYLIQAIQVIQVIQTIQLIQTTITGFDCQSSPDALIHQKLAVALR